MLPFIVNNSLFSKYTTCTFAKNFFLNNYNVYNISVKRYIVVYKVDKIMRRIMSLDSVAFKHNMNNNYNEYQSILRKSVMGKLKKDITFLITISCVAFIAGLVLCVFNEMPENDVAERYIPMVRAGLAGEWKFFFHPRIPPLFSIFSFIVALITGISAFMACKSTSLIFFVAGVFPLYGIIKNVFDRVTAKWGAGVYLLCTILAGLSYSGLRETLSCFSLLLSTYALTALWSENKSLRNWFWLILGTVFLASTRIEGQIFCIVIWSVAWVIAVFKGKQFFIPYRWLLSIAIFMLPLLAWCNYNYSVTGYFVTDPRMATLIDKLEFSMNKSTKQEPVKRLAKMSSANSANALPLNALTVEKKDLLANLSPQPPTNRSWLKQLYKGLFIPFLIFAIIGIILRLYKKKWSGLESLLAFLFTLYITMLLFEIHLFSNINELDWRYLTPALPLYFGWVAISTQAIYHKVLRDNKLIGKFLLTSLIVVAFTVTSFRVINYQITSTKRITRLAAVKNVAKFIIATYPDIKYDKSIQIDPKFYLTGRSQKLYTSISPIASFANIQQVPVARIYKAKLNSEDIILLAIWKHQESILASLKGHLEIYRSGDHDWDVILYKIMENK